MMEWNPKDPAPDKVTKLYNMIRNNTSPGSMNKFTPDELHDLIGRGMPIPDISIETFNGRKYMKNNLAYFLAESCNLLFDLAFPLGSRRPSTSSVDGEDERNSLQKELADTHRRIIDLQDQVIQLKDEIRNVESAALTKTVQRDLKSYSAILTQNCSAALAPMKIQEAVSKASVPRADQEDRSKNLMIFGLPEEPAGGAVDATVTSLLEELNEKPLLDSCIRLGSKVEGKVRPVKVTLKSRDSLLVLLRKACELRKSDSYSRVYIEPDRSFEERVERRKSIKTLNELRHEHPDRKYILRKGVIECI